MSIRRINSSNFKDIPFDDIYENIKSTISDENPLRSNKNSLNKSNLLDKDITNEQAVTKTSSKRDISPFAGKQNPLSRTNSKNKRNKGTLAIV